MAGEFYDAQGNRVDVDGVDPTQAVSSNGRVAVVGPDGVRGTISPEDLPGALADGYRLEGVDEHAARRAEQLYGGTGGQIRAGVEGLARGATFGLSDVVQVGLGRDDFERQEFREGLRSRRELNPVTSTVTEVAGGLLGPGKGVSKLGAGVTERVAGTQAIKALAGRGAVGKLAAEALPKMAGEGLEGLLYGAGSGVSDVALSDDPMAVDAILGTVGSHALYGGGVGVGIGGLSTVLGKATAAARDNLRKASAVAARPAEEAGVAAATADDIAGLSRSEVRQAIKAEETAAKVQIRKEAGAVAEELATAHKGLRAAAEEAIGLDPPVTDAGKAARRRLGATAGKLDEALESKALAKNPQRAMELLDRYETALTEATRGARSGAMEQAMARLKSAREKVEAWATPAPRLERLRGALEEMDLAGPASKPNLADKAREFAEGKLRGLGMAAGGSLGMAIGGPVGAAVGAGAGGLAGDALSALVGGKLKEHAAKAAGQIAEGLDLLLSGAKKASPAAVPTGTAVLERVAFGPAETARGTEERDAFAHRSAEISAAAANPEGVRAALRERFEGVRAVDIALGQKLEEAAVRRLDYLYQTMPKAPPGVDGWKPSTSEREAWARRIDATDRPAMAIRRIAEGVATPDEIEALDATAPDLMAAVRRAVFARLAATDGAKPGLSLQLLLGRQAPRARLAASIQQMHRDAAAQAAQAPQRPSALTRRPGEVPTMAQKLAGGA